MKTNAITITPELKEQFKTIFLDARESSVKHHKRGIEFNNDMGSVRSDITGYKEALASVCDLAFKLSDFSSLITSSLSEHLIERKKTGCLTERGISESFDLIRSLINLAYYREEICILHSHYYNKVDLIESVDIDELNRYIDSIFKN